MKLTLHTLVPVTDSRKQTFNIWKLIYSLYRRINITSKIYYVKSAHAVVEVGNFQNMPSGQRKGQSDVHMGSGCNLLENSLLVMGGQSFYYESSADWMCPCFDGQSALLTQSQCYHHLRYQINVNINENTFQEIVVIFNQSRLGLS